MDSVSWSTRSSYMYLIILISAVLCRSAPSRPKTIVSASLRHSRRAPDGWPIKTGYVAFGDSYAAGMGTGITSQDKCRIGENNMGSLIMRYTTGGDGGGVSIDYQRKMCSGDTITGLNGQIDIWQDPTKADVATLSIGGNDLGFSDIVYYCIITPNFFFPGSWNREKCLQAKAKATKLLDDTSESGLTAQLTAAYKKIVTKSTRTDFHLFVTGYVGFFNFNDPDCDTSSFYFFAPCNNCVTDGRFVLLTTQLRLEMDNLVDRLNKAIQTAIDQANRDITRQQIHYVNVNTPGYDTHRFCEAGDFHEPAPSRQDTYFFLSGWPDVPIGDAVTPAQDLIDQLDLKALQVFGGIRLPDAQTCHDSLGTDPDPYALFMCRIAEDISGNPNGNLAQSLQTANASLFSSDIKTEDVSWWYPIRQIKTFHPRSNGMARYRDITVAAIQNVAAATSHGICKLDLTEFWTCADQASNLYAQMTVTGPEGQTLYQTGQSTTEPGVPINDADKTQFQEPGMSSALTVVGEHTNDYIQFYYSDISWTTGTTSGPASCKLVGDNWNESGPGACPADALTRQFACSYPC